MVQGPITRNRIFQPPLFWSKVSLPHSGTRGRPLYWVWGQCGKMNDGITSISLLTKPNIKMWTVFVWGFLIDIDTFCVTEQANGCSIYSASDFVGDAWVCSKALQRRLSSCISWPVMRIRFFHLSWEIPYVFMSYLPDKRPRKSRIPG